MKWNPWWLWHGCSLKPIWRCRHCRTLSFNVWALMRDSVIHSPPDPQFTAAEGSPCPVQVRYLPPIFPPHVFILMTRSSSHNIISSHHLYVTRQTVPLIMPLWSSNNGPTPQAQSEMAFWHMASCFWSFTSSPLPDSFFLGADGRDTQELLK